MRSSLPSQLTRLRAARAAVAVALCAGCADVSGSAPDRDVSDSADAGDAAAAVEVAGLADDDLIAPPGVCDKNTDWWNVGYILDGDTLTIDDGNWSKVRMLGVAAPEIAHGKDPAECFGVHAWHAVKAWLPEGSGMKVCVRGDPNADDTDSFGRLLRYVYLRDGPDRVIQVNARLLRRGEARFYRQFAKGLLFAEEFAHREALAQKALLGGWKDCGWQPLKN